MADFKFQRRRRTAYAACEMMGMQASDRRSGANRAAVALAVALGMHLLAGGARAAEFQLKARCQSRTAVVTLGDVADICGADPRRLASLAAIELFPAPPAGQQRFVRARDIEEALLAHGINLAEHRFSGASQVAVGAAGDGAAAQSERPLPPAELKHATRLVRDAVSSYLRRSGPTRQAWELEFQLADAQARAVLKAGAQLGVSGGKGPWNGSQHLQITAQSPDASLQFPLDVNIARPAVVAVAARALGRGTVIRPEDVQLSEEVTPGEHGDGFHSLDELVGQEMTRAVSEGRILERDAVRSPIVIRRGDVVTVYARTAGICVRTVARAREDGSVGDLIGLESFSDRRAFFARVSGVQEAEVYARAAQAIDPNVVGSTPVLRR